MAKTTKKPCRRCWVPTCRNAKPKEAAKKKLFLFPRDVARCRDWVKAIGDMSLAETELRKLNTIRFVCEDHFPPSKITPQTRPAADAVPVLFEPQRTPLTEEDLRVFDVHIRLDDDIPEHHVDFTQSANQDSCMSESSSELSHSSFELSSHSVDHYYSLEPGDENTIDPYQSDPLQTDPLQTDPLQTDPSADFPWLDLSLPSLGSCGVDLSDPVPDSAFPWSCGEGVVCDSERMTSTALSPAHADFSIMQMSGSG